MTNNSTKVWITILTSSLIFLIVGYQLGERLGLLIGFLLAILLNFFVFYYGDNHILAKLNAIKIKGQDAWGITEKVQRLSTKLGMPEPTIYVTPHMSINAFCVGHSWKVGSLGLTTGLLQKLSDEELESVIAHQLCHIYNLNTFAFGLASTLANSIVGFGQFLDSFLPYKLQFFKPLFSPLGWVIIKSVVAEKSFFKNDLMAAELLEDRMRLGEILWRLEGLSQTKPLVIPPCTSHLFMVNPEGFKQKNLFLKSHPAIEIRLQKLMGYYPI
ncbi:MAG: M48 family metalloprotease [Pseudobdellovibrionaceae bacterium]